MEVRCSSIVFINKEGKFLLCKEERVPNKFTDPDTKILQLHPIGGKVDYGESPIYAACREFVEETKIELPLRDFYRCVKASDPRFFEADATSYLKNRYYFVNMTNFSNRHFENIIENGVRDFRPFYGPLESLQFVNNFQELQNPSFQLNQIIDHLKNSQTTFNDLNITPGRKSHHRISNESKTEMESDQESVMSGTERKQNKQGNKKSKNKGKRKKK